jgi:bifunctional oligoribonuclease and PAP phosphatase NrnA
MYDSAKALIDEAKKVVIIQAENPDGDSLGSALALEEILGDLGKEVSMYCPVDIPKYLHYAKGWDRVTNIVDVTSDLVIIVDTMAEVLLGRVLDAPGIRHFLETTPVLVIDHHETKSDLSFAHTALSLECVATAEIIYNLAKQSGYTVNQQAAESIMLAILSDSLGLTTQNVTPETYYVVGDLTSLGASSSVVEQRRREYMKKTQAILKYKGELIERIEYYLEGQLAYVHIPWDDIREYSDQYNPSMLVLDEMRLVEDVEVGVAIKTYPDGKLTGKIRTNLPIASDIAAHFGGGGHSYAAGFRVYESIDVILPELIDIANKSIQGAKNANQIS